MTSEHKSLYDSMSETDQFILQQVARDAVFEPFEGRKSLETLKKSRTGLEKGITIVKDKSVKAGSWIAQSKIATQSKDKLSDLVSELKSKSGGGRLGEMVEKIGNITEEIHQTTKEKYDDIEERTKRLSLSLIKRAFELVIVEDMEGWAVSQSKAVIPGESIETFSDLGTISHSSRTRLIEELYPYQSASYQKLIKAFNLSLNIGLGAVVATNLPGTGPAVSFINMGKTASKIGNRLSTMSAFFGQKIANSQALFKTSASILKSLSDWENNEDHLPVRPEIVASLYESPKSDDDDAFLELLGEIVKKDAYIAVPGVGSISLGKINLDDMKLDISIRHVIQDYHYKLELIKKYGAKNIERLLSIFSDVYGQFRKADYFSVMRKMKENTELEKEEGKWLTQMKIMTGVDIAITETSNILDNITKKFAEFTMNESDETRPGKISERITHFLENPLKALKEKSGNE